MSTDDASTDAKLASLVLDASYPLLALFREKCPGTYAHGKNVASLLEAVAVELELSVSKLKIAGQYHDIGKMANPRYFSENQIEEDGDPHAELPAHISYKIIVSHVGETAQILLNDENLPREIILWCTQHHGHAVVQYFYEKSKSGNRDRYRYTSATPKSLEAGLLMICDCLEAKCRALSQHNKLEDISQVVDNTLEMLIADRQLDEVGLPQLSYLRRIKEVLTRELGSIYKPKRIDYDANRVTESDKKFIG